MFKFILIYIVIINFLTFVIWGIDKYKAIGNKRRISENTLLLFTGIGGFLGAIIGMSLFRHKTIKGKFLSLFWIIVFVWIIISFIFLFNM